MYFVDEAVTAAATIATPTPPVGMFVVCVAIVVPSIANTIDVAPELGVIVSLYHVPVATVSTPSVVIVLVPPFPVTDLQRVALESTLNSIHAPSVGIVAPTSSMNPTR